MPTYHSDPFPLPQGGGAGDDIATPDDLEAIRIAREEYERGETISFEDIDWGDG